VLDAAVLHRVVQQGGDGLVLTAADGQHDRRHAEEMTEVGDGRPLAGLRAVGGGGVEQRLLEAGAEHDEARAGWTRRAVRRRTGPAHGVGDR
jgi:hypothetical protein